MAMVRELDLMAPDIGALVRHYRLKRGLSQEQLAELIGKKQRYVSELETSQTALPKPEMLRALFLALDPPADEFLMAILGIEGVTVPDLPQLPEGLVDDVVIAAHTIEGIQRMNQPEPVKRMMKDDFLRTWRRSEEERRRRENS